MMPKTPAPAETLLTVKQVAALDGCSEKTVRRAIAAGLLKVVSIGPAGRLIRIHPADHAAYRHRWGDRACSP
ncbi:helix-turn-helix domain-containing protein [Sulfitobacter aestuarii]|uniref:Helix-turn-helix domain-containing protein n=1 Tax=Sulfitobacter aestuarii TaxID=2161676 RepID=A0ABW5U5V6_9RHOB